MVATSTLELSVGASTENLRRVRRELASYAAAAGIAGSLIDDLRLCVNEAMANVIVHAYRNGAGSVDVVLQVDDEGVELVVRDHGVGISNGERSSRNGYGLRLMETLSERLSVESAPGAGTEVRMTFPRVR